MTRGVLGGLAGLIAFVVAAVVLAGFFRPAIVISHSIVAMPASPLRPKVQACELFYRWEVTHQTNLLNLAVADARSSRGPWQSKVHLVTEFSGLRSWIRWAAEKHAYSSWAPNIPGESLVNREHAIQGDCIKIGAGLNSRDRSEFQRDAAIGRKAAATYNPAISNERPGRLVRPSHRSP